MKIICNGIMSGFKLMADKTPRITIDLNELPKDKQADLLGVHQEFIKVLISSDNITKETEEAVVEQEVKSEEKKFSQSKSLRNIIYRRWDEQYDQSNSFEEYYNEEMNRIREGYKDKYLK